jgi:hypothetical protein
VLRVGLVSTKSGGFVTAKVKETIKVDQVVGFISSAAAVT